ncbi:glycosyltransferase [Natrialbaceae archaeon GCM10025810]|uniref:glycosyltransferase n=1 Tax=Halovalidus salilacus TaxID=3075124 RepID=UPI00361A5F90
MDQQATPVPSVCQLTSSHDPFDTRIFHKISRTLQDAGYDVSIVSLRGESTTRNGIEVIQVGTASSHSSKLRSFSDLYQVVLRQDPDIVQFHDPGLLPLGYAIAKRSDSAVVYDVHEPYETAFTYYSFPPDLLNPAVKRLFPRVESGFASAFDGITVATEDIGTKFNERGHERVQVVRNFPEFRI